MSVVPTINIHLLSSNLSTLQETVERFDTRCDEANDSLNSAEELLDKASGPSKHHELLRETIETVTTECKTRLHECVTYIEQAEIAVTEMEQRNTGAGKMDPHKDTIKGNRCLREFSICEVLESLENF